MSAISSRWHSIDALRQHLATPDSNFLAGIDSGEMIGTASARLFERRHVSLQWLYVVPRAQGRGHGKRLLEAAVGQFTSAERVTLDVEPRNAQAIAFYESQGFRQIALEKRYHAGSEDMAAVFEKSITR